MAEQDDLGQNGGKAATSGETIVTIVPADTGWRAIYGGQGADDSGLSRIVAWALLEGADGARRIVGMVVDPQDRTRIVPVDATESNRRRRADRLRLQGALGALAAAGRRAKGVVLSDGKVRLEQIGEQHLDGLAALGRDPVVRRNTRVPEPWPEGFEWQWLDVYEQGHRDGTRLGFAIVDAETGSFLGLAGLVSIEPEAGQGEIGYIVAPEARGRGIATRALSLVTSHALGDLGLERVELLIATDNTPSIRVAERCGYRLEGVSRSFYLKPGRRTDMARYSRLRTDG